MSIKDVAARPLFQVAVIGLVLLGVNAAYLASVWSRIAPGEAGPPEESSIAAAFLDVNGQYPFRDGSFHKGWSTIHELDFRTARQVEDALRRAASRTGIPVNYLAAYVMRESTGDPRAEFRNPSQWDRARDDRERFAATDHGLVQISGRNLLRMFPHESLSELKARSEDIAFAVDFLADYVAKDLEWAKKVELQDLTEIDERISQKARDPYWLAALAYNRGRSVALRVLGNPRACRHADLVVSAWAAIDDRTGAASSASASARAPRFPASAPDDPRILMVGDVGIRVEALQRLLDVHVSPSPKLSVDGNFGPATKHALARFQKQNGLEATGKTSLETWEKLLGLKYTTDPDAEAPLTLGDRGAHVKRLQELLNAQPSSGDYLIVDGDFGPATRDALIRFQQRHSLKPVGAADAPTWQALTASPAPGRASGE